MEYFTSHRRQQTLATTAWPKLIQQINNKIIYNIIATGQQKHFHLRHEVKSFFCFFRGRREGLWFWWLGFSRFEPLLFLFMLCGCSTCTIWLFTTVFPRHCRTNTFMHRSVKLLWDAGADADATESAISQCQVTWPRETNVLRNCISFGHLTRPWPHSHIAGADLRSTS